MTTPAAIASAVEDALAPHGIRITEVPITPQMIFDKMVAATADKEADA
jgi:CO/xanthine dehydrogenase Mo-binding subunit